MIQRLNAVHAPEYVVEQVPVGQKPKASMNFSGDGDVAAVEVLNVISEINRPKTGDSE